MSNIFVRVLELQIIPKTLLGALAFVSIFVQDLFDDGFDCLQQQNAIDIHLRHLESFVQPIPSSPIHISGTLQCCYQQRMSAIRTPLN